MFTFEKRVISILRDIKNGVPNSVPPIVPILREGKICAHLRAVTSKTGRNPGEIRFLAKWRKRSEQWFPSQFTVTITGTKKWVKEQLIHKEDRILFMIEDLLGNPVGHVGLYRFNWQDRTCEIDNIVRGENVLPGIMTPAILALCAWGKKELGVRKFTLTCFADNVKAISLYERCGFKEYERIPLTKTKRKGIVQWEEAIPGEKSIKRYFVHMQKNE